MFVAALIVLLIAVLLVVAAVFGGGDPSDKVLSVCARLPGLRTDRVVRPFAAPYCALGVPDFSTAWPRMHGGDRRGVGRPHGRITTRDL